MARGVRGPLKENISEERPSAQEDYGAEEQKHNCKSRSPQPLWYKIKDYTPTALYNNRLNNAIIWAGNDVRKTYDQFCQSKN